MPTCPVCTSSQHDTWGGVAVHIWKKQDDKHDMADSKDSALIWLSENDHITSDTGPSMSDPDDAETSDGADSSGNPVMGSADPDADPDGESADAGGVELPCGHESYDPDDAPEKPFAVACGQCSAKFRVTA